MLMGAIVIDTCRDKEMTYRGYVFRFSRLFYSGMHSAEVQNFISKKKLQFDTLVSCRQRRLVKNVRNIISSGSPVCFPKRREGFQFIAYSTFQMACLTKQLSERGTNLYLQQVLPMENV